MLQFAVGDHAFVVDGARVARVFPREAPPADGEERRIDVARVMDLTPALQPGERTWVRIDARQESYLLQLDGQVAVRQLARERFRRLPASIAGLGQPTGVIGTVEIPEGFAFVVDPDLLLQGQGDAGRPNELDARR